MIITICGSLCQEDKIKRVKNFLVALCEGDEKILIHTPFDEGRSDMPMMRKRATYINYLEESDVVIIVSKGIIAGDGKNFADLHVELGESVSWEAAIAKHFGKTVVYM